ncbi:hypothetical protein ACFVRH_42500, partial [Streptomyces sp. NPDC057909]
MPKKIDSTLRSQAVRLVTEHRSEYSSERAVHVQVAESLGVSRESVPRWVSQHEIDSGQAAGVSSLSQPLCHQECVGGRVDLVVGLVDSGVV